jgi:prepilin-type N-terminal cleavage/methylation domain-containing protein
MRNPIPEATMSRHNEAQGFSLVELLLVLAIMGIIAAVAIPSFLGQRRRARVIGDAQANAQVLRMALETRKADLGVYGTSGTTYAWTAKGGAANSAAAAVAPDFSPKGNSKMNYAVGVTGGGLTYVLTVTDPSVGSAVAYSVNQNGSVLAMMK